MSGSLITNANTRYLMETEKVKELEALRDSTESKELQQKCDEAIKAIYTAIHLCVEADSLKEKLYPED